MRNQIPIERFKALTQAAASVVGMAQLESLLGRMVETACVTTGARYGALGVIGEHKTLVEFVHRGVDAKTVERIGRLPEGHGVPGTLIRDGATIRLERISDHPDSVGFPPSHPPMDSFLGVPVAAAGAAFGNLYLTEKEGGFTEEDEIVVGALAAIAGSAVETARLRDRLEMLAITEDRERIGRDLHDSIIQDLFATGLELQGLAASISDSATSDRISHAVDRLDGTIDTLRDVVSNLHHPRRSTFEEELRAHVLALAEPHEANVTVTVRPPDLDLHPDLAREVMPVIGEAVSNALRHSGSGLVAVTVEALADQLVLSVSDRGRGFDTARVERGMGLSNLEERTTRLGGDLSIRSVVGAGTVVEAMFPLGRADR